MREIAEISVSLKDFGINEDLYSTEQRMGFFDHDKLYGNLEEIGLQHMISKRAHTV